MFQNLSEIQLYKMKIDFSDEINSNFYLTTKFKLELGLILLNNYLKRFHYETCRKTVDIKNIFSAMFFISSISKAFKEFS